MKLGDLVKAEKVVRNLADIKADINLSYKFMKFLKATQDDVAFYNTEIRKILNKYSSKLIKTKENNFDLDDETKISIDNEIGELNKKEIEAPTITFTLKELKEFKISAIELMSLEQFIIQEE